MKKITLIAALCLTAMAGCICCTGPKDTAEIFNREIYLPEYATGFGIYGAEGMESTIIRTYSPWQGSEKVETALFISRNGEQAPEGFKGEILKDSAARIICMSSTHISMLGAIGKQECIKGVSGKRYISDSTVRKNAGKIADIEYDGNTDYERLVSTAPDLVMLYGINGASKMEGKLRELGIPFIYIGDYLEESPLGKAEWMVAVSEVAGCRKKGMEAFSKLPEKYDNLRHKVLSCSNRPLVMVNTPYGESWFMPSVKSYIARLIEDAGGSYIYSKNNTDGSVAIDMEEALLLAGKADFWINTGSLGTLDALKKKLPEFAEIPCVQNAKVYNCDRRLNPEGGNDFWESGSVNPHLILEDLIRIFHPEILSGDSLYYYRKLE